MVGVGMGEGGGCWRGGGAVVCRKANRMLQSCLTFKMAEYSCHVYQRNNQNVKL